MPTPRAKSIVDVVRLRASRDANRPAYTYLAKGTAPRTLTYAALDGRARAIAAILAQRLQRQQRALMMYSSGLEFVEAFWACLYAGIVPVPVYPPHPNGHGQSRLKAIAGDCAPGIVLATGALLQDVAGLLPGLVGDVPAVATDAIPDEAARGWHSGPIGASDIALLQYSSGSTTAPKGVVVSHRNILANQEMVKKAFRHSRATTFVGWLPFFHDMGLFGGIVQPMFVGAHSVLMPPSAFLQEPVRWLNAISDYRAHTSGGPNFAYEYCVRRITEDEKDDLDLSCWKRAFNGAEKPRAETMRRFADAFARCGFREEQFYPCYGLAEATLFVSGRDTKNHPEIARAVNEHAVATPNRPDEQRAPVTNVSSGRTWLQQRIAIVDPEQRTLCDETRTGEVWITGPHVATGYWGQPALSDATFRAFLADGSDGPFLRTGDLGFLRDGELFVVGRLKDLIIIRGQNFHPEDIEGAVEQSNGSVDPGGCAAFAVEPREPGQAGERLVILIEAAKSLIREDRLRDLCEGAAAAVARTFGIGASELVVVRRGTIPKTSSGKIQRYRCREAYLAGGLDPVTTVRCDVEPEPAGGADAAMPAALVRAIAESDPGARRAAIRDALCDRLRILLAPAARSAVAPEASPVQIGLDSVRAVQLKHWIESATNASISIAELLEARSIEDLADLIDRQAATPSPAGRGGPASGEETSEGQLSHGQRALFFEHEQGSQAAYNISVAIRLIGAADSARIARAVSALMAHHPHLASTFFRDGDDVRQRMRSPERSAVERIDASRWSEAKLRQEVSRWANRPFDLSESAIRFVWFDSNGPTNVLLVVVHHILIDLFSLETLLRDLASLYSNGDDSELPAPGTTYQQFTEWEADFLASPRGGHSLDFWRQTLGAGPRSLRLPFCSTRSGRAARTGRAHAFELGDELTAAVRNCAAREQVTTSVVMLSAFAVLLTQYARERDVIVGASAAGRPGDRFAEVLGYFANILPLPFTIDAAEPFSRILDRVRRLVGRALDHQHYPYPVLTERLGPKALDGMPLVRYAFTYAQARHDDSMLALLQEDPAVRIPFGSLTATGFPVEREMAPFDITLMVLEWGGRLHGSFTYADDRVEAAAIPAFADAFVTLLSVLVRQPAERILHLAFEPRGSITATIDGPLAAGTLVLPRFERHAAADPDALALVYQDEHVTYGELNRRAEGLARYLRHAGIGPETAVAVHCPRGVPMIVGIIGILKAGGAYVPIDVAYPAERLRFVIEDAKVALVLTLSQFASRCETAGARLVLLDAGCPDIEAAAASAPTRAPEPASVAYVIYTSGSTGKPKGVAVTHANMSRLFDSAQERVTFGANDVWTLLHSISFDFSVWEMWGALAHGGTLVILDHDSIRDPAGTHARLVERQVTILNLTPSALYNLLPVLRERAGTERGLALRYVVCGGEALNVSLLAAWFEAGWSTGAKLVNMYGITETTVHTTAVDVQPRPRLDDSSSDIGQPLADVELNVVNTGHQRLPAYALGEIAVGGAGLARGYLFQPALTAARFVPNPFSATTGARLYLTGDLAYGQSRGHGFRYVGRVDTQVKVRGHRIELSDIEANLQSCDGVEWTTVRASGAPDGNAVLTAYVVCRDGLTVTELREHLARLVPDYMVPSRFFRVDAVPITENGKVDLPRLQVEATPLPSGDAYAPPRTDAERIIAGIWADVLGVDRVGIDDNYFALGGDSIRSIQIISRARRAGLNLALPRLFIGQTVRQLACDQSLDTRHERTRPCEPFELVSADDRHRLPAHLDDAFPVNRLLQGLIFHSEFSDDYQVYVTSMHVALPYVPEFLEQAIRAAVERHPFLRSSIDTGSYSEPLQLVHARVDVEVVSRDIRGRSPADQERYLRTWIEAEKLRKFDWRRAPLVRFAVHWRSAESFQLTLSDPYLDGWCVALLYRELLLGYRALLRHEPLPSRAPTEVGQRHFVALEQQAVKDDRSRDFWTRYLENCPESQLAAGYREGPAPTPHGRESVTIPGALLTRIDEVARSASAPLRSVLMAAHGLVLSCLLGQKEVVFGVIHNGRPEEGDADQAIGSFLNTVPFRVAVDAGESWVEYIRRVFAAESGIVPHRRFPFAELKALHGHRLVFDTVFNFTHFHVLESSGDRDDLCIRDMYASEQTYFPLTVHFNRSTVSGALEYLLDYDCRRLSTAHVESLAGAYLAALETLAGATGEGGAVGRASAQVEERLFPRPRAVDSPAEPQPRSVLDLFDQVEAERPDAIALVADDICLTYRQLRRSAEALARRLRRELEPGPDQLVGLHATHSCHAIIGILGIQKAGAAYVPIDEDCPAERMKFIVADCGMKGVVAENPLASRFEPFRIPVLHVEDGLAVGKDARAAVREPSGADPAALAYVIYTSGTTGIPKGVGVPHRAVANLARSARSEYGIVQDDRILQFCTLEFDISVEEIVMALCSGATLVLRPRDLLSSYDAFHAFCAREAITCLNVPTAFWNDWVHELVTTGRPFDLPIRLVIIAGEQMRPDLAWQWTNVVPQQVSLVNTYGPTETTVKATKYPVHMTDRPSAGSLSQSSPIGSGFGNTTISVLDARLRPVAPGVCGELHIGGPAVARGYLNRPRLTAERFIPDRWSAVPGSRCYRTGDIAFFGADDGVHFVGRLDRQVKITGYRVEPEELEAALMDCGGVRQAAVTVERSERGAALLNAFVRMEPDAADDLESTERRLREQLAARLPRYMMPSALHFVDRLPMTLSGKVDRTRLAALSGGSVRSGEPGEAGNRVVRDTIVGVYADTVGARHVQPGADFFTLGGDSLKAMRAASRLRNELRCAVSVRDIFENPRIERLAHLLERRMPVTMEAEADSTAASQEHVLSFSQERLWMADQLSLTAAAYNIPAAILIRGRFNRCAFEQSVEEVRRRHSVLRTRVVMRDGRLVPHLSDTRETTVTHVRMSATLAASPERDPAGLGSDFARARFDLERDAPIRMALCSRGVDEHLLLIVIHHVVADGWSIGLLIGELLTLYEDYTRGRPSSLPEPPAQYVDYARRQRAKVRGAYEQQLREYWLHALADMPSELALPLDYVRPAASEFRGDRHCFTLPRDVADAVAALGRSEGVTPFVVLLTAYVTLLHMRSGQTDIVVGTPVSTRDWPDTESLIGLFVNQLVIRTDLSGNPTCRQLVRRVRNAVLSAYDHRDLPFEDVVQMLRPRRGASSQPLVQTVLAYRDRPWQDVRIEGLELEYPELHNGAAKYDLEVQVIDRRDGDWQGYVEYNTDLFSPATIEKLAADYCWTLRAVVEQRDRPIASLSDMSCEASLAVTAQSPSIP